MYEVVDADMYEVVDADMYEVVDDNRIQSYSCLACHGRELPLS